MTPMIGPRGPIAGGIIGSNMRGARGRWFGRVLVDGTYQATRECTGELAVEKSRREHAPDCGVSALLDEVNHRAAQDRRLPCERIMGDPPPPQGWRRWKEYAQAERRRLKIRRNRQRLRMTKAKRPRSGAHRAIQVWPSIVCSKTSSALSPAWDRVHRKSRWQVLKVQHRARA